MSKKYEGSFMEEPAPGVHFISTIATPTQHSIDVIRLPLVKVNGNDLLCEYEILVDGLTDMEAGSLILDVLLSDLMDHYYRDQVSHVTLLNLKTSMHRRMPYPH